MKPCPTCNHQISSDATVCPSCGKRLTLQFSDVIVGGIIVAVVFALLTGFSQMAANIPR